MHSFAKVKGANHDRCTANPSVKEAVDPSIVFTSSLPTHETHFALCYLPMIMLLTLVY